MTYSDEKFTGRMGIDVSAHQKEIDWKKVKASGVTFVFIRIGFRGYGQTGDIRLDSMFKKNIKEAQKAGIAVGVYFFSQAVNESEAKEEAEFVRSNLKDCKLQLPVVYDPETVDAKDARTAGVGGMQFTKNAVAFCSAIKAAGYTPMIYANMLWEAYFLDLRQLSEYPIWYADYLPTPQIPYYFSYWQYSATGKIDGIKGNVDLNIQMIPRS